MPHVAVSRAGCGEQVGVGGSGKVRGRQFGPGAEELLDRGGRPAGQIEGDEFDAGLRRRGDSRLMLPVEGHRRVVGGLLGPDDRPADRRSSAGQDTPGQHRPP